MAWSDAARKAAAEARRRHGISVRTGAGTKGVGGFRLVRTRARSFAEAARRADKSVALRTARGMTSGSAKGNILTQHRYTKATAAQLYKGLRIARKG